jgi:hypothetical protein
MNIAESIGGFMASSDASNAPKDDFVVVSGFANGWNNVTKKIYSFRYAKPFAAWVEEGEVPLSDGFTHSGFVILKNVMYICGGYLGTF